MFISAKSEAFRPTTTMNLLPKMEVSGEGSERKEDDSDRNVKSMDLFPQHGGFGPSEDSRNGADMRYGHETNPVPYLNRMTKIPLYYLLPQATEMTRMPLSFTN